MPETRLTVLGCAGSYPAAGRACSSYLVEHDGYRLLLDCGNGSLSNLRAHIDVAEVDAVWLSHRHVDHVADLYGLYHARRFHPDGAAPLTVHAPEGTGPFMAQMLPDDDLFLQQCRFRDVAPGDAVDAGPLRLSAFPMRHPVPTLAVRVEAGERVLAYSGDTAPTPELARCARDADLFLCEATWLAARGPYPDGIHLDGEDAGRHADEAGAARLLITHVAGTDPQAVADEAATRFDGEVLAARDGLTVVV